MSDNKTPIQICIEIFEKQIEEIQSSEYLKVKLNSNVMELHRVIDTLKSHLALEEEAIKEAYEKGWLNGDKYDCMNGNDYFNQKFKPE